MAKLIRFILFNTIYTTNRVFLKLLGVKYGKNFRIFSIISIEYPYKLTFGDNVWVSRNCSFYAGSGIKIGSDVMIAKDVSIISHDHDVTNTSSKMIDQPVKIYKKPVIIDNNVWVGEKAIILKEVHVHSGAVIGAGAIVTKDVPKNAIVAGNPAKIIKYRI